jgi:hypothetical protein
MYGPHGAVDEDGEEQGIDSPELETVLLEAGSRGQGGRSTRVETTIDVVGERWRDAGAAS